MWGFPSSSDGKESTRNAGDPGLIPGSGRSPGEGNGNPLHTLAWRILWTEDPGGLQSMGSQRVRHNCVTFTFTFSHVVSGLTGQAQFSNFGKSKSPIKDSESVQPTVRRTALLTVCFKVF